jgi:hypothetical protein
MNTLIIFLISSIAQIHLHVMGSIPCPSAACFIVTNEVLSKLLLCLRMIQGQYPCSVGFSVLVTTLCNAVSVDLLFGKHVGFGVKNESSMHLP